jgi:signal transduction histidine kinase
MRRSITFSVGLIAIVLASVLLIIVVCDAQPQDAPAFAALIAVPLVIAISAALIGQRYGLWRRFRNIGVAMFMVYAIGAALVLATMVMTTRMMFISAHDAEVAVVITIYATGVTLVFGHFVVNSLADGIGNLTLAAQQVQGGNLGINADERGNDELSKLARAFNQMTRRLEHARAVEEATDRSRRDWIAWVSHDLRTPLTSLRARVEALSDGVVSQPDEVAAYLGNIRRDSESLNRLISDLGELATIDAGGLKLERVRFDIGDLVSDTLNTLHVQAEERGVTLGGSVERDVPELALSPQHVLRVLQNLTSNALAHTPRGGSVQICAKHRPEQRVVRVEIKDTGPGIAQHDLPHIFDRFYRGEAARSRAPGSGMGLGLVIARSFVEAHGGNIGIDSPPGAGTTAWFTVPTE